MRYDDASQSGSTGHSEPVARPDEDRLPPGSFGPATGNAITGAGTTSGASGADSVGTGPATITAVQGAGGGTVSANGAYQASGQYGLLSMDMQGNFSYVRNPGTPDGVKDVFNYTLADASGANSSTTLTIDIGQVAAAAAGQGIVNLPQGVELSDIHVNGRDLIVNMPDGTQMVIPGGAVFVPQIVIGDVQVPPTNLAALLIDNEPQPAAGPTQSSGGNFADPVPPLDPGAPLGDLIPPTELHYTPPEFREIGQFEDTKPTVVIEPHDLAPGVVDALDQVNEKGLPAPRIDGHDSATETPGTGEIADGNASNNSDDSENTFGQIVFTAQDGLSSVTVDGTTITGASVGTTIHGQFGIMTITSVNLAAGTIGYTYTLGDNTSGDNTADHFTVVVTDTDGDVATATLTVDIIDDVPIARNDTDAIVGNDQSTDGNVMTGVGTTSGAPGADTVGADNATLTGVHPGTSGGFTSVPQDGSGVTIHGTFGNLVLHDDGSYTYTRSDIHQGGTDVFTYQLTDGDGDTSTATLTITVPQVNQPPVVEGSSTNVSEEGLVGGNPDSTGSPDTTNSATASGNIGASDPDNDALTISLQAPSGSFTSGGVPVTWAVSDNGHTLTGSAGENAVITITIDNSGHYDVTLTGPLDDPNPNAEDSVNITVPVSVSDGIATTPGTLVVTVEDDSPVVNPTVNADATVTLDETGPAVASAISTGAIVKGDDPDVAGNGAISSATSGSAIVNAHAAFGGDGPAASDALTYALSITNASSGLTTTDGSAINLVMENGVIVGVVSGGAFDGEAAFAISINSATGVVTVEQYLSLDHPNTSDPNDALHMLTGSVGVTVTATDADGDHATSGAVDVSNQITFLDDGPSVSPTLHADATVTLDETGPAVASTISTGVIVKGDDPDVAGSGAISSATSGTAVVDAHAAFGADGPAVSGSLAYALSITNGSSGLTTTDGSTINLVMENGVIVGVVSGGAFDGEAAFAISINSSTGVVTVEQYLSLDHPDASNPNDALHMLTGSVGVTVTATDGDGDHVTSGAVDISNQITFLDDGPTVNPTVHADATVTLDETGPAVAAAINTGVVVKGDDPDVSGSGAISKATSGVAIVDAHAAFGADGPATSNSLSYALSITNASSGLTTTDGHAINLVAQGGVIVGVVSGGAFDGEAAFAISIDSSTGVVTVEQYLSLNHPITTDPNDALHMLTGSVGVTVTATDGDGDHVTSGAVDISNQITFLDDGPTVNPTVHADATVTLDETGPAVASAINTGVIVKGDDPDVSGSGAISKATSGVAIVDAHVAFGADGPATSNSLSYALDITNASSGLTTTDGHAINLVMENGNIVGVVSGGAFDGEAAFAISINSATGVVTVEQYLSLDHPNASDPNDALHMLTGSVGVTVTATDGDGDHVTSGAVDVSNQITFLDDGPTAHPDTNTVSEGGTVTGNVETNDLFGADGKTAGGGVTGVEAGNHTGDVVITGIGAPIAGTWGTLTLNADGSYSYHANANTNPPPGSTDVFTYTIKDGDGDPSTTTLTITVNDVTASVGSATTIVSEEVLPLVGSERNGDTDSDPTHDVLVNSGDITLTDSLGGATFTTALTAPSGTYTSGGTTIVWTSSNGGHTMTGTAGGTTILVATIDNTGHYTATLSGPIDTPNGVNAGENGGDSIVVFGVTATDNLGNTLTPGTLTVHVEDDAPTIDVTKGADSGINLTTDDADTIGANTDHASTTANFGGVFGLTFATGADGTNTTPTLAYTLGVSSSGVDSGLDSHGSSIFLYVIGGVVVGSTAASIGAVTTGNTIFDVSVNSSGQVTLDQFQQIDHPIGSDPTPTGTPFSDQSVSLADNLITLTASSSITDKDGDTATDHEIVNIGANLHFTDDGPTASTNGTAIGTVTLDETRPEGTDTTGGAAPSGDASATINFSTNFVTGASVNFGADGPGTVTYSLSLNGANVNSGLYALDNTDLSAADGDGFGQGGQIVLNQSGNTITGSFGGVNYFTIAIDPTTGVATFTELHNIWNPVAGSSAAALDDLATLTTALASDIKVVQTVTDFDGDTSTASINVGQNVFGIEDDGPRFGTVDTTLQIANSGTISGTGDMQITIGTDSPNGGTGNQNPDDLAVSNFTIDVNGSAAQNVVLTAGAENATTASYTFTFDYDTGSGTTDHETGTLVFDKSAGTYTVTLDHPVVGFTILDTAGAPASAFINYDPGTTNTSNSPTDVATVQLDSNFFIQFTGNSDQNTTMSTTVAPGGTFVAQSGVAFNALDLFSDDAKTVTISSTAAGVAGNTIQGGEVLDLNLYTSDPHGVTTGVPNQSATSMFIELDGVGTSEDMIVVLKLLDTGTGKYSEVALMVQNGDIIKQANQADLNNTPYSGIILDSNDGLIVIEPNDYQQGNSNLVIVGAQIAGSDAGITGTAINFNGALGATGGSSGTQPFSTDVSDQPFKIQNVGFLTSNTQDQNATISFDTTIHDADGDTATTHVDVTIGAPPPPAPIQPLAVQHTQVVSQTPLDTSSLVSSNDNTEQRTFNAGQNAALMGALAAVGLDSLHGLQLDHASVSGIQHSEGLQTTHDMVVSSTPVESSHADSGHTVQPTLMAGAMPHSAPQSGGTVHDMVDSVHSLTPANAQSAAPTDLPHGSEGPAHAAAVASAVTAMAVAMPSAEQLAAVASHGVAQVPNSVAGATAQHDQVVSKVLVDALHGGGSGPNIDAMLNGMPSHGGAQDALQALASHGASAVSFGHTAFADAFGGAHGMLSQAMLVHPDAVAPVHG